MPDVGRDGMGQSVDAPLVPLIDDRQMLSNRILVNAIYQLDIDDSFLLHQETLYKWIYRVRVSDWFPSRFAVWRKLMPGDCFHWILDAHGFKTVQEAIAYCGNAADIDVPKELLHA